MLPFPSWSQLLRWGRHHDHEMVVIAYDVSGSQVSDKIHCLPRTPCPLAPNRLQNELNNKGLFLWLRGTILSILYRV